MNTQYKINSFPLQFYRSDFSQFLEEKSTKVAYILPSISLQDGLIVFLDEENPSNPVKYQDRFDSLIIKTKKKI